MKSWTGWFWIALIVVIIGKIGVIVFYGPLTLGDGSFIRDAKTISGRADWLFHIDLTAAVEPSTLYRVIGYSLIIAFSKLISPVFWWVIVIGLQSVLSLIAGILLYRLGRAAGFSVLVASIMMVMHQWSLPTSTDALVMEDAIIGGMLTIAMMLILTPLVRGDKPRLKPFAVLGLMVGFSFLFRDVYHMVLPFLAAAAVVVFWRAGRKGLIIPAALLVILPTVLFMSGMKIWNYHRTGHAIVSTGGQTGYFVGVLIFARIDPSVLDGDDVVVTTIRRYNETYQYVDVRRAGTVLHQEFGMDAIEQAKVGSALFWSTIRDHPKAFIKNVLGGLKFVQQGSLFAGPITRIDDLDWWRLGTTEEGFRTGWRADAQVFRQTLDLRDLTPSVAWNLGIRAITRGVGLVLFAVLAIGVPIYWFKRRRQEPDIAFAVLLSWLVYFLWVSMFAAIFLEIRYLSPVVAPAIFAIFIALRSISQDLAYWYAQRRTVTRSP